MTLSPIDAYRKQIERELKQGDATEHTHRPALKTLLESLASGITATNEPKRIACGAPDFIVTRNKVPLGHVETKDVGTNLDEMERGKGPHGEQFKRYRDALPNWILTDYLDFRWFVAGEKRLTARIASLDSKGKLRPTSDGENQLAQLLDAFFKQEALTVGTAKDLAQRMAGMTRIVSDLIIRTFEHEQEKGWLHNWLAAFREVLIPDLDEKQFADMFAQTLAYGLFAAKVHSGSGKTFSREMAAFSLPKTNPFLRKLFSEIAGVDMPETIAWAVDDIVELLKHAEMSEILKDFGKGKGKEDPVVHFYETFLAAYDPKMRELRGVYYTPEPVVSYIVRSIDHLLKTRFSRPKGLADENTLILDPATGTATFLYFVIQQIYEKFANQRGAWDSYVGSHLLNRIFGFELLMAPYAVAHLKLGMELQQTGYTFASDQRLGIYLTNTLEEAARKSEKLFAQWISDEANAAASVKRELPIMVVLGNPPYSGHSANRSWEIKDGKKVRNFIGHLLQDYYQVDGQPLGERNPKWLQDDYVKFLRFGQWRIERTGAGVLAFITNHGYLDNPTFRGMRQQLMNEFTEIYVLDLHGSSKKKEIAPGGSKDENVFDIQQGVCIGIFVKELGQSHIAKVQHAELWGLREAKNRRLFETEVGNTPWRVLSPQAPFYLFVPQDMKLGAEYERGWKVTDVMLVYGVGMTTARDHVVMDYEQSPILERARLFRDSKDSDEELCRQLEIPMKQGWNIPRARRLIQAESNLEQHIKPVLYRPFDVRLIFYHDSLVWRTVKQVMLHLLDGKNLALISARSNKSPKPDHFFCSRWIMETKCGESTTQSCIFPLYLYDPLEIANGKQGVFRNRGNRPAGRRPNLNPGFIADLEKRLGLKFVSEGKGDVAQRSPSNVAALPPRRAWGGAANTRAAGKAAGSESGPCATGTFGPEDVFNYIYAVFHSPTYRTRYAEFLKSDFPRVPLTSNLNLFRRLCGLGAELVALHLLESPKLTNPIARFAVKGSNQVEKGFPKYVAPGEPEPGTGEPLKEGRVYINRGTGVPPVTGHGQDAHATGQYFEGVPPEVWNFHIGGYQVCDKWLKDRRGRTLAYEDLEHYCKVVTAINETIRVMAEIDAAIPKWPIE